MGHDATKVVLGSTQASFRVVDNYAGAIPAGKIVRLKSDGTITTAAADGEALGISIGPMLGNAGRTNVCRAGTKVPLLLTAAFAPTKGAQVQIDDVTGVAKAAGAGVTGVNAIYQSAALTAIYEDGTEGASLVCLVDMPGGL